MYASKFSLGGKVALITGGSRGIGRATSLIFADAGADIVVGSRGPEDHPEKVAEEVRERGRRALPVPAHLGIMENIDLLVKRTMDEFGRIDILVNNAATNPAHPTIPLVQ